VRFIGGDNFENVGTVAAQYLLLLLCTSNAKCEASKQNVVLSQKWLWNKNERKTQSNCRILQGNTGLVRSFVAISFICKWDLFHFIFAGDWKVSPKVKECSDRSQQAASIAWRQGNS